MATIVTRSGKGSPLLNSEVDANFTNLNNNKLELSGGTLTGPLKLTYADAHIIFDDPSGNPSEQQLRLRHEPLDSSNPQSRPNALHLEATGPNTYNPSLVVADRIYANTNQRVFADNYHPNADKWTTARTLTLGGDLTGNVSFDGSGNFTLNAQVSNDSHTHDGRYYTETESNNRFVLKSGDTINSGASIALTLNHNVFGQGLVIHRNHATNAAAIKFKNNTGDTGILFANHADQQPIWRKGTSATQYRIFNDSYHPNADKWTTARTHTVTLTGEVTGTASQTVDGTGNKTWTIATTLNNSALDDQYMLRLGDTANPDYKTPSSRRINPNADNPTNEHYAVVTYGNSGNVTGQLATHFQNGATYNRAFNNSWSAWSRMFDDDYHPNADKWTTARTHTVTLSGDVTGSASQTVDGTGNKTWSISATVADDSHNHVFNNIDITGLNNTTNLNDLNTPHLYRWSSSQPTNSPDDYTYMMVVKDSGQPQQWAFSYGGATNAVKLRGRRRTNGTWDTAWTQFFSDHYHPNADKWTTARSHTVTLTGDVTGTATQSVDGTGNKTWSINTSVANDSHTHDGRYLKLTGGTLTGDLTVASTSPEIKLVDTNSFTDANDRMIFRAGGNNLQWQWYDNSANSTTTLMSLNNAGQLSLGSNTVWHAGNDGSGSGLNADLLDGQHASAFAPAGGSLSTNWNANRLTTDAGANIVSTEANPFRWQRSSVGQTGQDDNVTVHVDDSNIYFTHNNDADGDASGFHFRRMTEGAAQTLLSFHASQISYKGNAIWHAGNDGTGSNLDADKLDGQHGSYYRNASNINAGTLNNARLNNNVLRSQQISGATTWASIASNTTTNARWLDVVNTSANDRPKNDQNTNAYAFGTGLSLNTAGRGALQMYAPEQDGATSGGMFYRTGWNGTLRSWQRMFDDEYHPNADKWTTARTHTVTLTGDVTGTASQSVDGTGNKTWTINTAVNNDSHTHTHLVSDGTSEHPDNSLQYFQTSGNTDINPSGDWYNSIRMGHGDPVTYYSNTIAVKMTGSNVGDLYTRTRSNGNLQPWNRFWHNNNDGSGSGLDADKLDGQHASAFASASHNHNGVYTEFNHIRSLGTQAFTSGSNPNITTDQVLNEMDSAGAFDSYSSVFKTSWSYAGNYNLTDAGRFTETAGSSWITWTDNSSDSARGNVTALAIAPNTGGSAGKVFIYNNQGSSYAPGWREVWTSASDGAGSGLDADLLDGQQGSHYLDYNNLTNKPTILAPPTDVGSSWRDVVAWSGSALVKDSAVDIHGSGYLRAVYLNMTHSQSTRNSDTVFYSSNDDYIRKNNAGGMRSSLSVYSKAECDAQYWQDARTVSPTTSNPFDDSLTETRVTGDGTYKINYTGASAAMISTAPGGSASIFQLGAHYNGTDFYARVRTDSSAWKPWRKLWHNGNDGASSGLDADKVDGIHASSFIRSDANDNVGAHTEWQDGKEIRLGNGADFRMHWDGANTWFKSYAHTGGNIYFQGEDTEGTNHNLINMITNTSSPYVKLYANGDERLRTTTGGVEIKNGNLTVGSGTSSNIYMTDTNNTTRRIHCNSSRIGFLTSSNGWGCYADNSGNWVASGNVTAYSDVRLKSNIQTIENPLEKVMQLRGVNYTKDDQYEMGVIAQEVEEVIPEVVSVVDSNTIDNPNGFEDLRTVSYGNMVAVLIEAMKEQQQQIEELKQEVEELKNAADSN